MAPGGFMVNADLPRLRGLVATVSLTGTVEADFATYLSEMRSWCDRNGFHAIEWRTFHAVLVEAGRDACVAHALHEKYDWLLQIDADAAPFAPTALKTLLENAYIDIPDADAVGAYAQLKQSYLPTIDTGTGTWEERYPGGGLLQVIRTGGHFLLTKCSAFHKFGPPWFRTRVQLNPIAAFAEIDNFARCHSHGRNPLTGSEWERLIALAKENASDATASVGEDSGFCDALCAAGGRIFVNSDLVVGHIYRDNVTPAKLAEAAEHRRKTVRLACGLTS